MATIPGFTAITGANLSTSDKTYAADVSAADPQDRSITFAELITFLGANGLILTSTKDQANGVAGLDANGQIVGPIILSTYANAAAAGVLASGTLAIVNSVLVRGDGTTTGGVPTETMHFDLGVGSGPFAITVTNKAKVIHAVATVSGGNALVAISVLSGESNALAVGTTIRYLVNNGTGSSKTVQITLPSIGTVSAATTVASGEAYVFEIQSIDSATWAVVNEGPCAKFSV